MTRILVSGDSHCDINHLRSLRAKKEKFECDKVFVVGDYGFFPRDKNGLKFLNEVAKLEFPIYFLAGNHEDWEFLKKHEENPVYSKSIQREGVPSGGRYDGFIEVHSNSFYAPTGLRWEWDGVKFLSVGGAYSIDRRRRTKFISWFPDETISEQDVLDCSTHAYGNSVPIDILLSHDSPSSVNMSEVFYLSYGDMKTMQIDDGTADNREKLQRIVNFNRPKKLIHGHWHVAYKANVYGIYEGSSEDTLDLEVEGLDCNQTDSYYSVIDTEDYK